jgi:peptidoglycan/xylan/chitin deacetylase (PgdA/CDA1 family)
VNHNVTLTTRHRLFRSGFAAISALGADRWLRPFTLGAGMILMFHHVRPWIDKPFAPNASLEITPEFLTLTVETLRRQNVEIVSLDKLPGRLLEPQGGPPFAVLTFDDGYRDNIEYAAPLLRDLDAPWAIYVVDEFASGRGNLWWLELERAIAASSELSITLDGRAQKFATATLKQKYATFGVLHRHLKAGPEEQLHRVMGDLRRDFNLDAASLVRELCADWAELRALVATHPNVTIGSHTLTHPILARCDAGKVAVEIAGSKDAIETRIGRPIRHFSFPHGDSQSAGSREFRLSRESGYETAVTTQPAHIFASPRADLWSLPRVSINGLHQTENALKALISGAAFLPRMMTNPTKRS